MHTIALLVAAGKSERMQMDGDKSTPHIAKPYLEVCGESLLRRTIRAFLNHPEIDGVRVVIRREHHPHYRQATQGLTLFPCVIGGDSRQESVRLGLESIAHRNPKYVLVHDIARPMVSNELISRIIAGLTSHKAIIPALPVTDTVKRVREGHVSETISRDHLYAVQTPQGFHFDTLMNAHQQLRAEQLSDDAALMEKCGERVAITPGDADNLKITTPMDLETMHRYLTLNYETRTGMGYDVHPLELHDPDAPVTRQHVKLCGVPIPFTHKLAGHSDADVGLHALVDAILGTISEGDIGSHFPPSDLQWKGANSSRFLLHAYELLAARGGEIVNLDVTLVCEQPRIAPFRAQMIAHIANLLKLTTDRVSVKATTAEKLGFIGRGEGIAAHAVATVKLPRK